MSSKAIIIGTVIFLAVMLGISIFLTGGQKISPKDSPKAQADNALYDFGEIKVSDVKQQDFTLKNLGSKPLQILNINTSCGCTSGQIIYKDFTSKEYSMHAQSGYVTEIAPGDTAIVRLTYRPASMPVYGLVEREVYLTTNDPSKQNLVFSIKANVK